MKKILTILFACAFFGASANAEKRIGISAAYTMFSSDGTETLKSSSQKLSKTHDDEAIVPSIFFEVVKDNGVAFGIDYVPGSAELGSGRNARTDTDTDDASDTSGNNDVSAELTSHTTLYVTIPAGAGYVKAGVARATIDTTETLATGTKYGNEDVNGFIIGLGINKDNSNGTFFRTELSYTNYEEATFQGTLDSDSVRNKIDGDVDAVAVRVSLGKAL